MDANYSGDTRQAAQIAEENGLEAVFFTGDNLSVEYEGKVENAKACIVANKVYIRADHPGITATQLMKHELTHHKIDSGMIDTEHVYDMLVEFYGEAKLREIIAEYAAAYDMGDTSMEAAARAVFVEIVCDSEAGINYFGADMYTDADGIMRNVRSATQVDMYSRDTRGPPTEEGIHFSKDSRDQDQVGKVKNNTHDPNNHVYMGTTTTDSANEDTMSTITVEDVRVLREIGKKSINDFSSDDIQKSEKWAAKFYRELGVKSPFFCSWFGNWRSNDTTPLSIVRATNGILKNGRETNYDTGMILSWNAHDIQRETGIHAARDKKAVEAIRELPEIIKNAVLLDTWISMPTSGSKMENTAFMHSFYTVYTDSTGSYLLKLYAEEALNNKGTVAFTRAYQLKDIKTIAALANGVLGGIPPLSGANTATINSVADLFSLVKQYDPDFKSKASSKVVNADGTPRVMYHGSPAQFTIFDKKKAKYSGQYGRGFYFTNSQSHAGTYGQQYSVYLNIRNPLEYGRDTVSRAQVQKFLENVAENEDYSVENYGTYDVGEILNKIMGRNSSIDAFQLIQDVNSTAIGDMVEAAELFNQVNGTEFDGIVVPTETVAFYSNQIKSATDNIGTFDGSNPDIRFTREMEDGELPAYEQETQEGMEELRQREEAEYGEVKEKLASGELKPREELTTKAKNYLQRAEQTLFTSVLDAPNGQWILPRTKKVSTGHFFAHLWCAVLFESSSAKKESHTQWCGFSFWQRMRDSNPRKRSQSPVCYRYTNPLCVRHGYYYTHSN